MASLCYRASVVRSFRKSLLLALALLVGAAARCGAQTIPSRMLRSVAPIVSLRGSTRAIVSNAFFVEVPSRTFAGRSFVYLVTVHHALLDDNGKPLHGLAVELKDSKTGTIRDLMLPPEPRWMIDPRHESADVAVLPLSPKNAAIDPIPIGSIYAETSIAKTGALPALVNVGAECYYLTAAAIDGRKRQLLALTHFARASTAEVAEVAVPATGLQPMYFISAAPPQEASGSPVFVRAEGRDVLWGMMEAEMGTGDDSALTGLAGVLPARYVAETIEAVAAVQEQKAESKGGR
jgi:hypothetical protein